MKNTSLLLVMALSLIFIGCGVIHGPAEEVRAFADEKEDVISQMGKRLEANPTAAGVDDATKVFEAKKDSLKGKKEAIKAASQGFNKDWQSLLMKTEARHEEMLSDIGVRFTVACYSDQCRNKWQTLEKDFKDTAKFYQ